MSGYSYRRDVTFDASGNTATSYVNEIDSYLSLATLWDSQQSYYDAGDRLRFFRRHIGVGSTSEDTRPGTRGVVEEYRYDALGRRILVSSRRGTACTGSGVECASTLERTVWDGDQILYELRATDTTGTVPYDQEADNASGAAVGRVAYVHAGGIDQPVAVLRFGMTG